MPTFGGPRKSSTEDESIQLSLNGTIDKFKSIEIVKQLHADGDDLLNKVGGSDGPIDIDDVRPY